MLRGHAPVRQYRWYKYVAQIWPGRRLHNKRGEPLSFYEETWRRLVLFSYARARGWRYLPLDPRHTEGEYLAYSPSSNEEDSSSDTSSDGDSSSVDEDTPGVAQLGN